MPRDLPIPDAPPKAVSSADAPDAFKVTGLFLMFVVILHFGEDVLMPVTLASLLAFVLAPLVNLLRRAHLGRVPSVLLGVILAICVLVAIGGVIGTQIADLSTQLPKYASAIEAKVSAIQHLTVGRISHLADRFGAHHGAAAGSPMALPALTPAAPAAAAPAPATSPMKLLMTYLSPVLSPIATLGIVFVVAVFALLQREDLRDRLIRLIGSDDLHRTTVAMDEGGRRLSRYYVTQLSINTAFGIIVGIGLWIIGVPNPVLWGVLSTLLRFVPYVGSFIAALLPMALAAAVEPGWSMMLWTAALYIGLETLTGQIIEPMVYGHSTGLSPFSVVVAAIFWSWLWGPIGLILSTPLTLCLVVMGRHVEKLKFLDILLGDRPALTPVESFYQRILAGDADETQDHAELLLKERSLCTYYDEVALKGLQLAANDAQRGVLNHEQLERVKRTIKEVVKGLEGHDDVKPKGDKPDADALDAPDDEKTIPDNPEPNTMQPMDDKLSLHSEGNNLILCIAGRGPLDEAASAMLVQLLGKHKMNGRLVGYDEVSRDKIDTLEVTGVAMACISYLEISGNPAHLRYLMQRLRAKLPKGTPILVGLWPNSDPSIQDKAVRQEIGADYFACSLLDAVNCCVKAKQQSEEEATTASQTLAGPPKGHLLDAVRSAMQ